MGGWVGGWVGGCVRVRTCLMLCLAGSDAQLGANVSSSLAPFKWTGIGLILGGCLVAAVGVLVWYLLLRRSRRQEAALAESKAHSADPLNKEEEGQAPQ